MISSVIEWRASFEAAIAITKIKMRAAQVMSIFYDCESGFAIGTAARLLMKSYGVELANVQRQAGTKRRPRRIFLLGGGRTEE
jgi:hypothetical protein